MNHECERRLEKRKNENDVRDEFDRDEARLIHSAAFRRLQSKTQVLGLGEGDFYRTRLTHSMEVAQIGRGIVQYINKSEDSKDSKFSDYKNKMPSISLITAICLAHDIGHPPFGHGGEVALNYCMKKHGGFEGNAQTLRILGRLGKYTENHGLNPTRRMLLGVLKYPVSYNNLVNEHAYRKDDDLNAPYWLFKSDTQKPPKCYYDCDQEIVDFIFETVDDQEIYKFKQHKDNEDKHRKALYKSLDSSIMNLADNISYTLHDLEDALSLGMINRKQWDDHFYDNKFFLDRFKDKDLTYDYATNELFSEESYKRKNVIGKLVHLMISNVVIKPNGSGCDDPLLSLAVELTPEVERLREHIFELVYNVVIKSDGVQQLEFKGQNLVVELFQVLTKDPERFLPESTKRRWKNAASNIPTGDVESAQMRIVCDFISGMTDDYAIKFYEKLFVPSKGSIFDRI